MIAEIATWVLACLLSPLVGWPLVGGFLRRIRRSGSDAISESEGRSAVLRGGAWIGILERLAMTISILAGYPAGIAVIVAIKGLGRFPELLKATGVPNARDVSELFIIGTLASMLWAGVIGLIGRAVLAALPGAG